MKILVLGSTSFAARNLVSKLRRAGHEVWTFNRRADGDERALSGNPFDLSAVADRLVHCDVLINYLLVKDGDVDMNLKYCEALASLARRLTVRRLIHLSSISVLPAANGTATEATMPEPDYRHKGDYARIKIATEIWLVRNLTECETVMVRPGFIVAPGLADPVVGMAKALPTQRLLGLGVASSIIPLVDRDIVDEAVEKLCSVLLSQRTTYVVLVHPDSPTRADYLSFCCNRFGLGTRPLHLPGFVWSGLLRCLSVAISVARRKRVNFHARFEHNLKTRRYDSSVTMALLNLSHHQPWRELLATALERQEPNYTPTPVRRIEVSDTQPAVPPTLAYLGFGRIVQDRHLPALARLKYKGVIQWYDPFIATPPQVPGLRLERLERVEDITARHVIIAAPPFARPTLVAKLPMPPIRILLEKPLALTPGEAEAILDPLAESEVFVIHNYRFKANVQSMLKFLSEYNTGELIQTRLHFDSPSVDFDKAAWLRQERFARTLLADYSVHFVDLAWMLAAGPMQMRDVQVRRNLKGQTESIEAALRFENCSSYLFLRQGVRQRRCQIEFVFQNCSLRLRFFPESFSVVMGQHSFMDDVRACGSEVRAVFGKIGEKLNWTPAEPSHEQVLTAFIQRPSADGILQQLNSKSLADFYERLYALGERVYAPDANAPEMESQVRNRLTRPTVAMAESVSGR